MKAKLEINGNKVEVEGSPAEIRGVLGFDSLCGHTVKETVESGEAVIKANVRGHIRKGKKVAPYLRTGSGKRRKLINWNHFIGRSLKAEIGERYERATGSPSERRTQVVEDLTELAHSKGAGTNVAGFSKKRLRQIITCNMTSAISGLGATPSA
jgi:hypothetical protein